MAQVKRFNSTAKFIGLPDTTNVEDKQLRLYLDRLNQSLYGFEASIEALNQFTNMKYLVSVLIKDPEFLSFIKKVAWLALKILGRKAFLPDTLRGRLPR